MSATDRDRDELAKVLDPHWRTDCSDATNGDYVRWVRCRCGWESERNGTLVNAPDMHLIWNLHLGDVLAAHVRAAQAEAWQHGYLRGTLDTTSDLEPADNPYLGDDRG